MVEPVELSVVVPAYNEATGIRAVVTELGSALSGAGLAHEILVVDDGSTDGTDAQLDGLPGVRLLKHAHNRGYGAALKTGIAAARAPVVAITDADGTYPGERLPELHRRLVEDGRDMVVGARTGAHVHIPLVRRPAKALIGALANYLSGHKIPDLNSGLRVMRRDAVMECFNLISNGFSFTTTVTLSFLARNRAVTFVPIDYARRKGSSKIRPIRDTLNFLVLLLRVSVYFEPLKVFLPVAGLLTVAGGSWAWTQRANPEGLGDVPVLLLVAALQVLLVGLIADMISRAPGR